MKLDKPYIIEEFDNYTIKIHENGAISVDSIHNDVVIYLDNDEMARLITKASIFKELRIKWKARNQ